MKKYHYKVEYLRANIKESELTKGIAGIKVAQQVEAKINDLTKQGYELYQQFNTSMQVKPGCLGGLLGKKTETVTITTTVFRKEIES